MPRRVRSFVAGRPQLRKGDWAVVAAVASALVGGQAVAHDLLASSAAPTSETARVAEYGRLQEAARKASTNPVPFVRKLTIGDCGASVRTLQIALVHAHVRDPRNRPTGCYGVGTVRQVQAFQRRTHVHPASGAYGPRTHAKLSRFYTPKQRETLRFIVHAQYVARARREIVIAAEHAYRLRSTLRYSQSASRGYFPAWPGVPTQTDCSGFATWLYRHAALPDPNGLAYSPIGYTGTLGLHGRVIRPGALLKVGDLVLYGGYPFHHVTIVIRAGTTHTALVVSHGRPGLDLHPPDYRPIGQIRRDLD